MSDTKMVEVDKLKFYATVGPTTAMPSYGPERAIWRDPQTGRVFGYSYPGYLCRTLGGDYTAHQRYFLHVDE